VVIPVMYWIGLNCEYKKREAEKSKHIWWNLDYDFIVLLFNQRRN